MTDPIDGDFQEPGHLDETDRQVMLDQTDLQMVLISTRRRTRLTQADVDRLYGIDQSQLSDLERGRVIPRDSTLRRLAVAYAQAIPGTDPELIYQRFAEAKARSGTLQLTQEDYDSSSVLLRIELYSPEIRKSIWHMISVLLDELDIVHRIVARTTENNDSLRGEDQRGRE
jgi:transcriptional regulator with XRE-family HTH domain